MRSYIDYDYYFDAGHWVGIDDDNFDRIEKKASAFVREATFDRINEENLSNDVKDAVCAVCEVLWQDEMLRKQYGGREVKSENNDGFSVTFVTEEAAGRTHEETLRKKMYTAARPYLLHTGLLYLG